MNRVDLWNFAVSCYGKPGVESACLELQAAGADVCLFLTGAWLECRGVSCSAERLGLLKAQSKDWQTQVVQPLRNLRSAWREAATHDSELAGLRDRVKMLELDAERIQLNRLASVAQQWPGNQEAVNWLDQLVTELPSKPDTPLSTLRHAAFSQLHVGKDD